MPKKPGVGYAAANRPCPSVWEYQGGRTAVATTIREDEHPFGPDGGGPASFGAADQPLHLLAARYLGGRVFAERLSPQGLWADMYQINIVCAERWFADQPKSHRDRYDGVPTLEDLYDVAVSNSRRKNGFYAEYWFSRLAGGKGSTAIIVDDRNWWRYAWLIEEEGWGLGLHDKPNSLGYSIYYDVRFLGGEVPVEPPVDPPPPPPPDPEPEPPGKRYSTPEVRAEELWEMVEEVFRGAKALGFGPPPWLVAMKQVAKLSALPLLPDVVRAKRRFLGQPEEGSP